MLCERHARLKFEDDRGQLEEDITQAKIPQIEAVTVMRSLVRGQKTSAAKNIRV